MWVGLLVVLLASAIVTVVGWWAWQEKLPRQHWAGIRTPYAMANDEQWKAVHRFGAPYMIFGGVASFSAALAVLPFSIAGVLPEVFAAGVMLACAIILGVTAIMSWQFGVRAAKAHLAG